MKILKLVLITIPVFKIINYSEEVDMIICAINTSDEGQRDNFMQIEQNRKQQHTIQYKSEIWSNMEKYYNAEK